VKKIGFIGAGNIAEAIIRGLISSSLYDSGEIIISDAVKKRTIDLNKRMGVAVADDNLQLIDLADVIFISVKPNMVESVLYEIKKNLLHEKILISLAAGKSLGKLKSMLDGYKYIVRIMPNLAAKVRKSTVSLYADSDFSSARLESVKKILSAFGRVFVIEDELLMPSITALSGSAPAYYVMMANALIEFGVEEGMERELATKMILQTMEGAALWAESSKIPLSELWQQVVTPGGTTEAGINHFTKNKFLETFVEGLRLATKKAKEMGDG